MTQFEYNVGREASNILTRIKISNSFLFLGVSLILISFFCQLISGQFLTDNITVLSLSSIKIGLITLIFGAIFSLLNVLTNPYQNTVITKEKTERNINPFNKEAIKPSTYKLFLDLLNRYEKNILFTKKTNYTQIEGNNWNNLFIYSLWTFFLIVYIIWINVVIEIIPNEIDLVIFKIYPYYLFTIIIIILIMVIIFSFRNAKHHINPHKIKK